MCLGDQISAFDEKALQAGIVSGGPADLYMVTDPAVMATLKVLWHLIIMKVYSA